ncbi:MAG TPA: prepilin peptidase [Anaeromyxobacteraceae bacterium]
MERGTIPSLLAAGAAALGASLGSFLNVVVARVPAGLSIVRPGSRCPRCLAPIAWHDNVPVLSWVLLRGRCRACRGPISPRYPLVEAAGAGAALLALWRHGPTPAALAELALVGLLLALALVDLDTWLLPHSLTWPLLASGVALAALGLAPAGGLRPSLYGAGVGFAAFALVAFLGERVFGREALGWGDVWLLAGIGAWLGLKALLPVVLLASIQGTAVGLLLAWMGKLPRGTAPLTHGEDEAPGSPLPGRDRGEGTPSTANAGVHFPSPPPGGGEGQGEGAAEDAWVPPRNAVPFGPFLVAGALEWLYLGQGIAALVPALELFR